MRYPGGKGKVFQQLINLMPPHEVYIETHVGGGSVLRNKRPAPRSIAIDKDELPLEQLAAHRLECDLVQADAVEYLRQYSFTGKELVFSDPPYPAETRRSRNRIYRYDYTTDDHVDLLETLVTLPCAVMITSYDNQLYAETLKDWVRVDFRGVSHVGSRPEVAWMNFQPGLVHDHQYLGGSFRQREAFKRKRQRWLDRFTGLSLAEQQAVLADLSGAFLANAPPLSHLEVSDGR